MAIFQLSLSQATTAWKQRLQAIVNQLGAEQATPNPTLGIKGTWTPVMSNVDTYTTQQGSYFRLGPMVHIWGRVEAATLIGSPAGTIAITGLPYDAEVLGGSFFPIALSRTGGWSLGAGNRLTAYVNGTSIFLHGCNDEAAAAPFAVDFNHITATSGLYFNGAYATEDAF